MLLNNINHWTENEQENDQAEGGPDIEVAEYFHALVDAGKNRVGKQGYPAYNHGGRPYDQAHRCGVHIESGEEREYTGQMLCEDCYMDALSPVKTCDPWAVYTAKLMSGKEGRLNNKIARRFSGCIKKNEWY